MKNKEGEKVNRPKPKSKFDIQAIINQCEEYLYFMESITTDKPYILFINQAGMRSMIIGFRQYQFILGFNNLQAQQEALQTYQGDINMVMKDLHKKQSNFRISSNSYFI